MLEQLAAAAIAAVISAGSASAMAAAKRSGDTREAVLQMRVQLNNLDKSLTYHIEANKELYKQLDVRVCGLESRVTAIEAGFIDRRSRNSS